MKWLRTQSILFSLAFSCVYSVSFASYQLVLAVDSEEERFKHSITVNNVLPLECFAVDELNYDVKTAWEHQRAITTLTQANAELLPAILSDGQVPTSNNMGFQWGYSPAIVIALSKLIRDKPPLTLLEIGCAYGCDAIELIRRYSNLSITAVDISSEHIRIMNQLMLRNLDADQQCRLSLQNADFRAFGSIQQAYNSVDIAVISKVLHFYNEADIVASLNNLYPLIKPGGYVIMSNMACECHRLLKLVNKLYGGYGPAIANPGKLIKALFSREKIPYAYYFSTQDMERIIEQTYFHMVHNLYTGHIYDNNTRRYRLLGVRNSQGSVLYTVLRKPSPEDIFGR